MADEPLKIGKKHIDPKAERWIILIGALAGIFLLWRAHKSSAAPTSTVTGQTYSGGTQTGSGTDLTGIQTEIDALTKKAATSVEFKFATDNSNKLEFQTGKGTSGGGSGSLNVLGLFSIGGGGSKSSSSSNHIATQNTNTFSTDVIVNGADPTTLAGIEQFLMSLAGTEQQRTADSIAQEQVAYSYLNGGKTIVPSTGTLPGTGTIVQVPIIDPITGRQIGQGQVNRTGGGYVG